MKETIEKRTELLVGPGSTLRLAREALKLSVVDVSRLLRLREQQIQDIENDNYQNALRFVFLRGYLRSYAKLVRVSPDEVIAAFEQLDLQEMPSDLPVRGLRKQAPPPDRHPNSLKWISYAIALGLVTLVAVWWHSQRNNIRLTLSHTQPQAQTQTPVSTPSKVVDPAQTEVKPAEATAAVKPADNNEMLPLVGGGEPSE